MLLIPGWADQLDADSEAALEALAPDEIAVLGATASISEGVEGDLRPISAKVRRFSGNDRFDTNQMLNGAYRSSPYVALSFLANGSGFADALAGAAAAAAYGAPIYLSRQSCIPRGALYTLDAWDWDRVILLGGEPSLSSSVANLESCEW